MRSRYWYFALLVLPAMLGNSNVHKGGDYLPGALTGLIVAVLIIAIVEAARFLFGLARRLYERGKSK